MRSKKPELCDAIVAYIRTYRKENSASPSMQEIADELHISKSSVSRYIAGMREQGLLELHGSRGVFPVDEKKTSSRMIRMPVIGNIACGRPILAEENIENYVDLPFELFGYGDFFILRASGNSMIGVGIQNGDLVIVRRTNYADPGQIVVALVGDEATLKRYYPEPEKQRVRLHPENNSMRDILVRDCMVQGVAVKVLKTLD